MLVGDDLPELGADLVAALATLHVDDLAHGEGCGWEGVLVSTNGVREDEGSVDSRRWNSNRLTNIAGTN